MSGAFNTTFDAQVTAALFDTTGAIFALGDGAVVFESGERAEAHDGAVLCACVHPSGDGVVTGGDDGKLVWSKRGESAVLATTKGQWIDAVDAAPETGLIAFSAGRTLTVPNQGGNGCPRSVTSPSARRNTAVANSAA